MTGLVELLVCVTCRRSDAAQGAAPQPDVPRLNAPSPDARREGAALFMALAAEPPEGVRVRAVECLQNCRRGCTVALRGPGRWTYLYGALHEADDLAMLREGAVRYRDTVDGLVPWRERPDHFRKNCIARVPPLEAPE
ncbi:MAG: DUF1636 family protein [Rubrimonas sp.]